MLKDAGEEPFKNILARINCDSTQYMVCCKRPPEKCGFGNIALRSRIIGDFSFFIIQKLFINLCKFFKFFFVIFTFSM